MVYHQVIVSYDIEDTKTRTKLRKDLMGLGLVPVQKSVMWGYLNKPEEKAVITLLSKTRINVEGDSIFLAHADLERTLGDKSFFGVNLCTFEHPDEDKII